MRPDLPRGVLAAQVCHAAGESSTGDLGRGTFAVVLQADKAALISLEQYLQGVGIKHKAIRESDEPYTGDIMAIGLAPAPREEVRRHLSSYPLLR